MNDQHLTTLGAPISYEEYEIMQNALLDAKTWLTMVPLNMPPEKLLAVATRLVDHGFKLRDAVQAGLNAANTRRSKRLVGGYRAPPKSAVVADMSGFSQDDLLAALAVVRGK